MLLLSTKHELPSERQLQRENILFDKHPAFHHRDKSPIRNLETSIRIQYLRAYPPAKDLPKYSKLSLEELGLESGTLIINYPKVRSIRPLHPYPMQCPRTVYKMYGARKKCTQHSSLTKKLQVVSLLFGEELDHNVRFISSDLLKAMHVFRLVLFFSDPRAPYNAYGPQYPAARRQHSATYTPLPP